ncbi:MAG: PQQ-dependent sugar dehydrogenase, partial [Pseudomonadales bacterium]
PAPLIAVAFAACGGGGGGSSAAAPPPPPAPPPAPAVGIDARPANATCVAPQRTFASAGYALQDAFPSLPDLPTPMKLMQSPGDGSVWYALGRSGSIDRFAANQSAASLTRYLNLPVTASGEGGLLSAVFHPDWPATREIFVSYTIDSGGFRSRLSRLVITDDATLPASYTEQVILTVDQPQTNHNGGDLAIGPDGNLYLGIGDGGGANDPNNHAQNTTNLLGNVLRLDVVDVPFPSPGYDIPPGNPLAANPKCGPGANAAACPEIFAYGFRNPWRLSFDGPTGDFWVADVGQNAWEEINRLTGPGGNYGWRCKEGSHDFNTAGCPSSGLIDPVYEYAHVGGGRSVTGGYVYRGSRLPALAGRYLFADYLTGQVWALRQTGGGYAADELVDAPFNIASFSQGNDGEVLVLGIGTGRVYRLEGSGGVTADNVPASLADTGCVDPTDVTAPSSGLVPYAPAAPFWSDGAGKHRWLGLPDGATIDVGADDDWAFPPGTVIRKDFDRAGRLLETRLFMRHPDGEWVGYSYEWNSQNTAATRIDGGATRNIDGEDWIFPSQTDCLACHTEAAGFVLGLETAQMNVDFRYPASGVTDNQIRVFNHIGLFSVDVPEPLDQHPVLADPADASASVDDRARAYLHSNCAQCHQPNGPTPTDLDLRYATRLEQTGACDALPQRGDLGIVDARIIAPGDAVRSVLVARADRRDADGMPPLASAAVDAQGVVLLATWVDALTACP